MQLSSAFRVTPFQFNPLKLVQRKLALFLLIVFVPQLVAADGKMAAENESNRMASLVDANTQLTITTNLPDTLCPAEIVEVCVNLSQRCGGDNLTPLPGRNLIFFTNAGDCGANVGQAGEDTVLTDAQGNACLSLTVSLLTGEFAVRVKFLGEDKPEPCPEVGNNGCSPSDPVANKRCITLSTANTCVAYIVDTSACGCGTPILTCPVHITQSNDPGQCGAVVNFEVKASGRCAPISVTCAPTSGSFFLVGTTTVTCTATDTSGNSNRCSFAVSVQDTEHPRVTCPGNISVNTGPNQGSGVPVSYSASAVDNCASTPVSCMPPSGSLFPVGVTAVGCTASDASGNTAACSFTVTVNSILFFQQSGANAGDQFGSAVAGGGDVNGDGFSDFIVSLPGADAGGAGNSAALLDVGSIEVFSGASGSPLYQIDGLNAGDRLGGSVGTSGDVNGDGYSDLIAGAPDADANGLIDAGAASVYSGDDGSLLYKVEGGATADRLGGSVGIMEDVNGDGYDEFLVAAPGADVGGFANSAALEDAGAVFIYSGADGSLLNQLYGAGGGDRLGGSLGISSGYFVTSAGNRLSSPADVSSAYFIVGAPDATVDGLASAGAAYVYSGTSGQLLYQIGGTEEASRLGGSVGISGDVNGDGVSDIIVGAPYQDVPLASGAAGSFNRVAALVDAGTAYVYSGLDGTLLYQFNGTAAGDRLGGSVGAFGDVNADGHADFMVAAPYADPNGLIDAGTVTVYSGSDGTPLFQADGSSSGDRLGGSVSMFGSVTYEDGLVRFLIGAPDADAGAETDAGTAFVYQIAFKGDLNGDGHLAAADLVLLLRCIFLGTGYCPLALTDMNCDGSILSPTDVVIMLNAVFLGDPVTCVL